MASGCIEFELLEDEEKRLQALSRRCGLDPQQFVQAILCSRSTESALDSISTPPAVDVFTDLQLSVEPVEKLAMARWVLKKWPVFDGDGVVVDAGSSTHTVWNEILRLGRRFLTILTNNTLIIDDWRDHSATILRDYDMRIVGSKIDPEHKASYGVENEAEVVLMQGNLRAKIVFIGTSGVEVDPKGQSIFFGYHQPSFEQRMKELWFRCPAKVRVILAAPSKIGTTGGQAFDLLSVRDINTSAPIFLLSTIPEDARQKETYVEMREALTNPDMQKALTDKGLEFHWVTIDPSTGCEVEQFCVSIDNSLSNRDLDRAVAWS